MNSKLGLILALGAASALVSADHQTVVQPWLDDFPPSPQPSAFRKKRAADPIKKASRKRQKSARAKRRRSEG